MTQANGLLVSKDNKMPTYEEANFTRRALMNGFVASPAHFNPCHNWFGVSACAYPGYTPDAILTRGNKKIQLSLQGFGMPMPKKPPPEFWVLADKLNLKYLGFFIDGKAIYQTWYGELPDMEFIENFISAEVSP